MLRRLYFVLPDARSTARVIADLEEGGVDRRHMAITAHRLEDVPDLGVRVERDDHDRAARVERLLWNANLGLFGIAALAALTLLAWQGLTAWLLLPLAVMAATFGAGLRFTRVPNAHLHEFTAALRHGELLLSVDVAPARVREIEDRVHRRHPAAAVGGVGWGSDLLHV